MRKSNTLGGKIDSVEYHEAELNDEVKRLKSPKCTIKRYSLHSALDRRNTAMKSLKRLLSLK